MKTLAFDTSTKFLTIACLEDDNVLSSFHEDVGIRHSDILVPTIDDVLLKAGWRLKDVELLAVGIGPGSFTGLRIAVATVKGFLAVIDAKVVGVPTMDAIVQNGPRDKKMMAPFLDARKEKVYSCIYESEGDVLSMQSDYLLLGVEDLIAQLKGKVFFFGDGIKKYKEHLDASPLAEYSEDIEWYPKAPDIARLGVEKFSKGELSSAEEIDPMYLHAKECNVTTKKKRD